MIISTHKTFTEWFNETIVEAPDWLVKLCIQPHAAHAQTNGNGHNGQPIRDREFNVTLANLVGSLQWLRIVMYLLSTVKQTGRSGSFLKIKDDKNV